MVLAQGHQQLIRRAEARGDRRGLHHRRCRILHRAGRPFPLFGLPPRAENRRVIAEILFRDPPDDRNRAPDSLGNLPPRPQVGPDASGEHDVCPCISQAERRDVPLARTVLNQVRHDGLPWCVRSLLPSPAPVPPWPDHPWPRAWSAPQGAACGLPSPAAGGPSPNRP